MEHRNNTGRSGNNFLKIFINSGFDFYWIYCNNGVIQNIRYRLEDEQEEIIFERIVSFESLPIEIQSNVMAQISAYYKI